MTEVQNCYICKHYYVKILVPIQMKSVNDVKRLHCCASHKYSIGNLKHFPFITEQTCCEPKGE